ncbi:hypothetical protein HU200_014768 [Digitaria exilis]|uniref:Uncharacterized protein n=1 Tax=Digitaria exilis TaxID=1010633 RepID=A0A835FBN9_9POAL|nr:hypothetical protein HU200_014768 [Digitaria exilis]
MLYSGHHSRSTGQRSSSKRRKRRAKLVQPNKGSSLFIVVVWSMELSDCQHS